MTRSRQRPRTAKAGAGAGAGAGWIVAFVILATSLSPGAFADTKTDLAAAKAHLKDVEARIAQEDALVSRLHGEVAVATGKVATAQAAYDATRTRLAQNQAALHASETQFGQLQARLNARAAAVYIQGPGSTLEMVLGASSLSDFADRVEFADRVQGTDADLAHAVQRQGDALKQQRQVLSSLRATQATLLGNVRAQQRALSAAYANEQHALTELSASRQEASALVTKLQKRLRAEELAAARAAASGGMSITFGQWGQLFLPKLGASTCHENLVAAVAWENAEYTSARWNPLATSYPMPGSTTFNGSGVQNYTSLDQGLQATVNTLAESGHGYEPIMSDFRGCADAMTTAKAINASAWCGGCSGGTYVMAWVPLVEQNYSEYANQKPPGS